MFSMRVFIVLHLLLLVLALNYVNSKETKPKPKPKKYDVRAAQYPGGYVDGASCNRPCGGSPMRCYFNFAVETFYTMSKACYSCPTVRSDCFRPDCIIGGGVPRTVMVINRQMPGPSIEVCKGDMVMVHMENHLQDGEGSTIHYHGLHMYGQDAYFDGVPYVTQCPVHWNNNFTYEFTAYDPGTHWHHSHVEMQRGDGMYGALIVRTVVTDYQRRLYDRDLSEHIIMVGDWNNRLRLDVFEAYALHGDFLEPTGILVNGLGYQFQDNVTNTPLANFVVEQNIKYRFRFINVGFFDCPVEFSIDGHVMTIIASDGQDVQPVNVNSFISSSGERFDFVINANQRVSTYWIRVKGYLTCERLGVHTVATLQYRGSTNLIPTGTVPTYATSAPTGGVLLNPISAKNATASRQYTQVITIAQLRALVPVPYGFSGYTDYQYYITVDMSPLNNPAMHRYPYYGFYQVNENLTARTPQFNHISYKPLDRPVLPNRYQISYDNFCNEFSLQGRDCINNLCSCTHVIYVPLNSVVEFVFIEEWNQDDAPALHPIHLHGYSFRVLAWSEITRNITKAQVMNMDRNNGLPRNYQNPPLKDTVSVPKGGYTIVRFTADNPGFWFMHCHIDVHASEGMDLILKVGDNWEMPDAPENFPKCGNWLF